MSDNNAPLAFRNLLPRLFRAPLRFPLPLACGMAWAAATITREHDVGGLEWEDVERLQVTFMCGFFLTLAATLFGEGRGWHWFLRQGTAAAALGLAAFVAHTGGSRDAYDSPAFYLLGPGSVLLMTVAPFLRRGADNRAVWNFNLCSWVSALFGLIVASALGLGVTAFLIGLETLFGVDLRDSAYGDVWIVCMSVVWPWQTLAGVPGDFKAPPDARVPRWAEYLVSWLLVPLALLYLGMLVAFSLMILVQWNLPRGTIGWMVGIFAAYGVAAWSAAYPLRESGNVVVRLYHRFFHYALAVPVLLLALGVGRRVAEYGVTEKRYALVLLAAWLAGIALYGVLKRPARLTVAPATFGAMLVLAALGPWGATSISLRSQLGQIEALLSEAGIMVEGRIVPGEGLAGPQEARRISGIVRYMRGTGKLDDLKAWMATAGIQPGEAEDDHALLAQMGLDYIEAWEDGKRFSYHVDEYKTIDVAGFEMARLMSFAGSMTDIVMPAGDGRRYKLRFDGKLLSVSLAGQPDAKVVFDLDAMAEALHPLDVEWSEAKAREAMTIEAEEDGLRVRLHVESLSGQRNASGNRIDYGRAVLMVGPAE
jgi:hypothetical protein